MKTHSFAAILTLAVSATTNAHNNLFLPGDAFFSAKFEEDFFERQKAPDSLTLSYHRFYGKFMRCGYAGYANFSITDVSPKVAENLRSVHRKLFDEFREHAYTNPYDKTAKPFFPVIVYNRNFPLTFPIGLKFNEDWAKEQVKDAGKGHAIYDDIGDRDLLIADWATAAEVSPLAIDMERPPFPKGDDDGAVEEPVTSKSQRLKFVVPAGNDILRFALRKPGLTFFVVSEKIARYQFDTKGNAQPVPFDAGIDKVAVQIARIESDRKLLRSALDLYRINTGSEVTEKQGLSALVRKPEGVDGWLQTLAQLPKDPWGNDYDFNGHEITSRGPDGERGTDDDVLW